MTFVDSPMSGGVVGAKAGTLTFMVGTDSSEAFERAKIVLAGMGQKFFHCGGSGTGEIAKIVNNLMLGVQMNAVAEGMSLGDKLGIDPKKLQEILSVSTAGCWANNKNCPHPAALPGSPASKNYEGGFQVSLIRKDMALALELANEVGSSLEFVEKGLDYYVAMEKKGHGGKDFGFAYQYISKNKKI